MLKRVIKKPLNWYGISNETQNKTRMQTHISKSLDHCRTGIVISSHMRKPHTNVDRAETLLTSENEVFFIPTENDDSLLFSWIYYFFLTILDDVRLGSTK